MHLALNKNYRYVFLYLYNKILQSTIKWQSNAEQDTCNNALRLLDVTDFPGRYMNTTTVLKTFIRQIFSQ